MAPKLDERGISQHRLARVHHLDRGGHNAPGDAYDSNRDYKMCVMEAVSWVCNLPWGDAPQCVDPRLISFGIHLNDDAPPDIRQQMIPLIPQMVGTAGDPVAVRKRRVVIFNERVRDVFFPHVLQQAKRDKLISPEMVTWYDEQVTHKHAADASREINHRLLHVKREQQIAYDKSQKYTNVAAIPERVHQIRYERTLLETIADYAVPEDRIDATSFDASYAFDHLYEAIDLTPQDDWYWSAQLTLLGDLLAVRG